MKQYMLRYLVNSDEDEDAVNELAVELLPEIRPHLIKDETIQLVSVKEIKDSEDG